MQIAIWPGFPFPRTDSSDGAGDGDAEGGETVQHGDPDVELRDLPVEVPRHEALAQKLDAVHLRFGAAPAVVVAPSSPDRAATMA